jgi:hypothetical protein
MEKISHRRPVKRTLKAKNGHSTNGKSAHTKKHNIGEAILSSLEAIKEGNVIVIKQDELEEGIKKLLK